MRLLLIVALAALFASCNPLSQPCTQLSCPLGQVCNGDGSCTPPSPVFGGEGEGASGEGEGASGEGEGEGEGQPGAPLAFPLANSSAALLVGPEKADNSVVGFELFSGGRQSAKGMIFPRGLWVGSDGNVAYLENSESPSVVRVFAPDASGADHANDAILDVHGCTNVGQIVYVSSSSYLYRCASATLSGWFTASGTKTTLSVTGNMRAISGNSAYFIDGGTQSIADISTGALTPVTGTPTTFFAARPGAGGFVVVGRADATQSYTLINVSLAGTTSPIATFTAPAGYDDGALGEFNTVAVGSDDASVFTIATLNGTRSVFHISASGTTAVYNDDDAITCQQLAFHPTLITGGAGY